jgi:hypothetical protein
MGDELMAMDANRKAWNQRQKELRRALEAGDQHEKAIELFLTQHAMLHTSGVSNSSLPSFEDEVFEGITEEIAHRIPRNCEHSIAWCIWHIARIEDVTMNMLVAGSPQVFSQAGWHDRLGVEITHTGNAMDIASVRELSAAVDVGALRAYRQTVGRQTREIVRQLKPGELKTRVDPARLAEVMDQGAVVEEAGGIVDYWSRRTIAGLLLMPPTRHCFVHLNEALSLKKLRV